MWMIVPIADSSLNRRMRMVSLRYAPNSSSVLAFHGVQRAFVSSQTVDRLSLRARTYCSSPHPASYTAYAFIEKEGKLQKIDVQWKDPQAGEIVVKVLACGVCASDEIVQEQPWPTGLPRVPGHEIIGDIIAVSPAEKLWKVGQRIGSGWHGGHCFVCNSCRSGDFMVCEKEGINGIFTDGGYAEYVTLRSEACANIPDDLDPAEAAPLLCAGITTFNALRNMSVEPPEYVAVQGIGGLGHLGLQFARHMGFRTVALSSSSAKEELSRSLGAHEYIDGSKVDQGKALSALGGAKVILCTAPNPHAIETLIPGLAVDGQLVLLALAWENFSFPRVAALISKRLSLRGWPSGTAKDSEDCVTFAKAHGIKCMVERFPLDKAQEAFDRRSSARFRAVIIP
ncbi:Alcohol dehydrogenase [Grifola frondosa]|uniref:Alcohol dehydrogenase n=1 Tax=Grifola frondosa TaxID=5627 RepID=A0A1C7MP14_GRIFR|nr:Alcohol dehydrogenase [Grifola frondosa]